MRSTRSILENTGLWKKAFLYKVALTYLVRSQKEFKYSFTKKLLHLRREEYAQYLSELKKNRAFLEYVSQELRRVGSPLGEIHDGGQELLYIIARALKPQTVVETGVAAGVSSAFILRALEDNGLGELYSVDMPNYDVELWRKGIILTPVSEFPDERLPGFVIPPDLKRRWNLRIGLSKDVLSPLLCEIGEVDIFLHDSEHSYENMKFEYETSWPSIRLGGLLLSHDVSLNTAFLGFSKAVKRSPHWCVFSSMGGIRK